MSLTADIYIGGFSLSSHDVSVVNCCSLAGPTHSAPAAPYTSDFFLFWAMPTVCEMLLIFPTFPSFKMTDCHRLLSGLHLGVSFLKTNTVFAGNMKHLSVTRPSIFPHLKIESSVTEGAMSIY